MSVDILIIEDDEDIQELIRYNLTKEGFHTIAALSAHDVRLACHGIDAADNEFVIGLVGGTLHPLSHLVQAMRKTRQTSEFIAQMGPFFVGHVAART